MPTKPEGGGGGVKAFEVFTLVEEFFSRLPLRTRQKCENKESETDRRNVKRKGEKKIKGARGRKTKL